MQHRSKLFTFWPGLAAALALAVAAAPVPVQAAGGTSAQYYSPKGVWMSGDFHTHTYLSDGDHQQEDVVGHAFDQFGLGFMANSEHGGQFNRTPEGDPWPADTTFLGSPAAGNMWRWQSLKEYSFPLIDDMRLDYATQPLIQGYEWNVPSHEHASVGILGAKSERAGLTIAQHEYLFDQSDSGTTSNAYLALGSTVKSTATTHAKAVAGAAWLQSKFPTSSYFLLNHPSRKLKYTIADIRDLNNAGPSVTLGLEGMPGHQKEAFRGGYGNGPYTDATGDVTYKARTYGGADYMLAKTGGLWDALLGEGRRFWVVANSDFHSSADDADFWPGEYAKTWILSRDRSALSLGEGLRSGNMFIATGDLVDGLNFYVRKSNLKATMGQTISVKKGSTLSLVIRFRTPAANNCDPGVFTCTPPQVDHVDVIQGNVTGIVAPADPNYTKDTNDTTAVIARLNLADFEKVGGWHTRVLKLSNVQNSVYLRLRGTNEPLTNLDFATGDPLVDISPADEAGCVGSGVGCNTAQKAWDDLWFYSNPIFVSVK